jgi:hypothetical protein
MNGTYIGNSKSENPSCLYEKRQNKVTEIMAKTELFCNYVNLDFACKRQDIRLFQSGFQCDT